MSPDVTGTSYVVAVSGGVDSVALLHMLAADPQALPPDAMRERTPYTLHVAHYDHGMRADSGQDRQLVETLAARYGVSCVSEQGRLGAGTSEAAARAARYAFLQRVRQQTGAQAIVTAHHQDDVLETILINLLRGTGSRGLHSLRSTDVLLRPLLGCSKQQIRAYARAHTLEWREDSTNADRTYLRNYIRHRIMPRFDPAARQQLLAHSVEAAALTSAIDELIDQYLCAQPASGQLDRLAFTLLPHAVAREVLAVWLQRQVCVERNRSMLERLVTAIKTGRAGTTVHVGQGYAIKVAAATVTLASQR